MTRVLPEGYTAEFVHGRYLREDVERVLGNYKANLLKMPKRQAVTQLIADATLLHLHPSYEKIDPSPHGGCTFAYVKDAEGNEVARGMAQCSVLDNFDRSLGRTIALGRALKKLEVPKAAA